jgi:hypothetical protein
VKVKNRAYWRRELEREGAIRSRAPRVAASALTGLIRLSCRRSRRVGGALRPCEGSSTPRLCRLLSAFVVGRELGRAQVVRYRVSEPWFASRSVCPFHMLWNHGRVSLGLGRGRSPLLTALRPLVGRPDGDARFLGVTRATRLSTTAWQEPFAGSIPARRIPGVPPSDQRGLTTRPVNRQVTTPADDPTRNPILP